MSILRSRWILLVMMALLATVLAACENESPILERIPATGQADPTSVPVLFRTPAPTVTVTLPISTPTVNLDPLYYFGGMMVTLDDVGKTVSLKEGQDFYLSLGEHYQWTVEIEPTELASQNMNITPEPGDQGLYIARETGRGVLRATGAPDCRQANPPCARPDILFEIFLVIE